MNNYLYAISKTISTLPSSVGGGACGFNWIGSGGGEVGGGGGGGGGGGADALAVETCAICMLPLTVEVAFRIDPELKIKKKELVQHKPKKMVLVTSVSKRLVSVIPLSCSSCSTLFRCGDMLICMSIDSTIHRLIDIFVNC